MRDDIRKAIKFVEKAVIGSFLIGLFLGVVIGGLIVFGYLR